MRLFPLSVSLPCPGRGGPRRKVGLACHSRAQPSGLFEAFPKTQLGSKSAET